MMMMMTMMMVSCFLLVMKKNNILQLQVDAVSEHRVGPKQSRSSGAKQNVYVGGVPSEYHLGGWGGALPSPLRWWWSFPTVIPSDWEGSGLLITASCIVLMVEPLSTRWHPPCRATHRPATIPRLCSPCDHQSQTGHVVKAAGRAGRRGNTGLPPHVDNHIFSYRFLVMGTWSLQLI